MTVGAAHGIPVGAAPTVPSSLFFDAAAHDAERRAAAVPPITSPHSSAAKTYVPRSAPRSTGRHRRSASSPHASSTSPNPGSPRPPSVAAIQDLLAIAGLDAAVGVRGLATAFLAEAPGTRPGPTVAILTEYDALPGVGRAAAHPSAPLAWCVVDLSACVDEP